MKSLSSGVEAVSEEYSRDSGRWGIGPGIGYPMGGGGTTTASGNPTLGAGMKPAGGIGGMKP